MSRDSYSESFTLTKLFLSLFDDAGEPVNGPENVNFRFVVFILTNLLFSFYI